MNQRAVFINKDGTLIRNMPYNVDPGHIRLMPGVGAALARLHVAGYQLIVISNQSGVTRGYFSEEAFEGVEARLRELLAQEAGVLLDGFYYCPHHPESIISAYPMACSCHKPAPGLLWQAAQEHQVDLRQSWFVGDILDDVEAGRRAGCRTVLLVNGNETEWVLRPRRWPHYLAANFTEIAHLITSVDNTTPIYPACLDRLNLEKSYAKSLAYLNK